MKIYYRFAKKNKLIDVVKKKCTQTGWRIYHFLCMPLLVKKKSHVQSILSNFNDNTAIAYDMLKLIVISAHRNHPLSEVIFNISLFFYFNVKNLMYSSLDIVQKKVSHPFFNCIYQCKINEKIILNHTGIIYIIYFQMSFHYLKEK